MNRNKLILLTAVLLLLAGGGWFLHDSGFFQAVRSLEALRAYIAGFAPYSHLLFFLVQFLSVVFAPIPSNIVAAAGGVLFGTLPGFLITFTAVASASLVTFSLARVLGREFAGRIVSKKLSEKYQGVLRTKAPVFLTLAFLFPFFPDDILCILAGLTSLSFRSFALIVLLARPWGLLFASALGGSTLGLSPWVMVPIALVGLALFLLGMKYGNQVEETVLRRLKEQRSGDTE
ncbi:TVP38/TMEM64 family protein [Oscillospiraceae bacterium 44-5]